MAKKAKEQISCDMKQMRNDDSTLEKVFAQELIRRDITTFSRNDETVFGEPSFAFKARKIAVCCDSELWHGFNLGSAHKASKSNRDCWALEINRNIERDREVTATLCADGWTVLRFWEHQINKSVVECVDEVVRALRFPAPKAPFRTLDLCAGIGGIRRGFEMTGSFENVLSAEKDAWACKTYKHLFGDDPNNDVTSEDFKLLVERTPYDSVGAMVDFPDQTLITAAPETWSGTRRISDDRFAKALGVDYFALPTKISYSRFPEWYFCPKCRKFQPIGKWVSEYQKRGKQWVRESDPHMIKHMTCTDCKQDLVVTRIVTVCEHGHINDFPWVKWVHKQSKKAVCANPSLLFKTGASGSEGLEGLIISCSCGAFTTLKGAFEKDCFEKLDKDADDEIFRCEGNHPHKNIKEKCGLYPRTTQRGSSSVYFPVTYSSLVIPP